MSTVFLDPKRRTFYHRSTIPLKLRHHFKGRIEFWRIMSGLFRARLQFREKPFKPVRFPREYLGDWKRQLG